MSMVMKKTALFAGIGLALAAAAPVNWANMVTLGALGSHVVGNPRAKVRVVEYFSYSCSHCAHFAEDAAGKYKLGAIARGEAAYELRNSVRDRYDLAAAVLARCGGPSKFMGNTEALMANQSQWLEKAVAMEQKSGAALAKLPPAQGIRQIMTGLGFNKVLAARGFTPAQINACAANPAALKAVLAMTKDSATRVKVPYTPYFEIGGAPAEHMSSWNQVEAMIRFYLEPKS